MKTDRFVFAQLTDFLDRNHFNYLVRKYDGDKYVKSFTCWNQMLTLMFGQLSSRDSLRDLIVALDAHRDKCYRLGLGRQVTRSNLAKANENRDCRIFEGFAYHMIDEARKKRCTDIFKLEGNVYAFDSPLANRAVLQVVEAAPQNQEVLGYIGKRGEDPNLRRHHHLLPGGCCTTRLGHRTSNLRGPSDIGHLSY